MRLRPVRRSGLSLMEVLAALAIFLMSLVALVHLVNTASNFAFEGHHRSNAARICRSKMAEVVAGSLPLQGHAEAEVDDEPSYRWSVTVESGAAAGLSNVTVRVTFHPDGDHVIEASLSRMVLDPTVTGSYQDIPPTPISSDNSTTGTTGSTTTKGN